MECQRIYRFYYLPLFTNHSSLYRHDRWRKVLHSCSLFCTYHQVKAQDGVLRAPSVPVIMRSASSKEQRLLFNNVNVYFTFRCVVFLIGVDPNRSSNIGTLFLDVLWVTLSSLPFVRRNGCATPTLVLIFKRGLLVGNRT